MKMCLIFVVLVGVVSDLLYNSRYSFLEEKVDTASYRHLYPGYQYPGWVNSSEYVYFYTHINTLFKNLDDDDIISLYVTPLSGEVDVYAGRFDGDDYPNEEFCQNNTNCFISTNVLSDIITFKKNDPRITASTSEYFRTAVYCPKTGLTQDYLSEFSITIVTTNIALYFLNGIPQIVQFNPGFNNTYYTYNNYYNHSMTFSLLPISGLSGVPVFYMSGSVDQPGPDTPSDKVYVSTDGYSANLIVAKSKDPQYVATSTWHGTMISESDQPFLYVTNWVDAKNYTILMEGLPVMSQVYYGKPKHFLIRVPSTITASLTIHINPIYRHKYPDLYINGPNVNFYPFPNPFNFNMILRGDSSLDGEYIIKNPMNGWWKVSVFGTSSKYSEFSIFFVSESDIIELSDQMEPMSFYITNGGVQYFKYHNLEVVNSIHFNVETVSGDVNGYISLPSSHYARPTPEKYDEMFNSEDLFYYYIFPAQSEVGDYYFSIFANKGVDAEVMVSVNLENQHTILENDVPIYYDTAEKGLFRYYVFYARKDFMKSDSSISISVFSDDSDVDVYVSTDNPYPDNFGYTWKAISYGNDIISIEAKDEEVTSSTFFIGVYGYGNPTVFSIVAYTSNDPVVLYVDQIIDGQVKKGVHQSFSYNLVDAGKTLTITLTQYTPSNDRRTSCVLKCYANWNKKNPSKGYHDYESKAEGKGQIITIKSAKIGMYYIDVEGDNCATVSQDFDIYVHVE